MGSVGEPGGPCEGIFPFPGLRLAVSWRGFRSVAAVFLAVYVIERLAKPG